MIEEWRLMLSLNVKAVLTWAKLGLQHSGLETTLLDGNIWHTLSG